MLLFFLGVVFGVAVAVEVNRVNKSPFLYAFRFSWHFFILEKVLKRNVSKRDQQVSAGAHGLSGGVGLL